MKRSIFIFHGTGGYPEENWFPWLKEKCEQRGHKVFVPQFPTPEGQSLEAWFKVLENYRRFIDKDSVFIGHSLGGMFLLRVLENLRHKVAAAYFVGTPIGVRPILNYDKDETLGGFDFAWGRIRNKADNFIVFHSDNDPYVSLANGKRLSEELGVSLSFVPNAGHFNRKAGYTKFEELWAKLEPIIS